MNENINLCEILKGLEGIELWSPVIGNCILTKCIIDKDKRYPITVEYRLPSGTRDSTWFNKNGKYLDGFEETECVIFPSKDQRDWSKFEKPIPVDTPMMCSNVGKDWTLRYYKDKSNGTHRVTVNGFKSYEEKGVTCFFKTIPFDKFNPNDIEESLKYNIQK